MKSFSRLCFVSLFLFVFACVPRVAERPGPGSRSLSDVLSRQSGIDRIDASMDVVFEKQESEMYGDAVLDMMKDGDLQLKVYAFGILAMDLSSKSGVVRSTPKLDKNRTAILTKGMRDSLFWWDIAGYSVLEEKDRLILMSSSRQVVLDSRTMLPLKQVIFFDDGKQLNISYDSPAEAGGIWYQSKMKIELTRYTVTLTVRKISFSGKG